MLVHASVMFAARDFLSKKKSATKTKRVNLTVRPSRDIRRVLDLQYFEPSAVALTVFKVS